MSKLKAGDLQAVQELLKHSEAETDREGKKTCLRGIERLLRACHESAVLDHLHLQGLIQPAFDARYPLPKKKGALKAKSSSKVELDSTDWGMLLLACDLALIMLAGSEAIKEKDPIRKARKKIIFLMEGKSGGN